MKYVLLFFAVLLAAFGGLALATGFKTVFDGEAANLTAGVVALGCGVIVVGQVFILRALESLRASFEQRDETSAYARVEADEFDFAGRAEPSALDAEPPVFTEAPPAPSMNFDRPPPSTPVAASPASGFGAFSQTPPFGAKPPAVAPAPSPYADEPAEAAHAETETTAAAARIDPDLLLEAALATPPEPPPVEPAERPAAPKNADESPDLGADKSADLGFAAPRTSPSLTEMWRRIAAKPEKADEPPPPIMPRETTTPSSLDLYTDPSREPGLTGFNPLHEVLRDLDGEEEHQPSPAIDSGHAREDDDSHHYPDEVYARPFTSSPFPLPRADSDEAPPAPAKVREEPSFKNMFGDTLSERDEPTLPFLEHDPQENPRDRPSAPPAKEYPRLAASRDDEPVEIGRYQADGTTYVMYSDGSIEAQSDQGVYRFGSMAELKAFFEQHQTAAQ